MSKRNKPEKNRTDYSIMSTAALKELLKHDLRGDLLDAETISIVMHILTERTEQEDPDSIPPIDLEWKSFRENYLSIKARLRRFMRRVLLKLMIVLAVLTVIAAILWLGNRPLLTENLLDIVTLENGIYTVDGLRAGATPEEVIAVLDNRGLPWSEVGVEDFWDYLRLRNPFKASLMPESSPTDITWISIRGSTQIKELGKVPVHRTFYFTDGHLTSMCLETEPIRGNPKDSIILFRFLVLTAEAAFGQPVDENSNPWIPADLPLPGRDQAFWHSSAENALEISGEYTQQFTGGEKVTIIHTPEGTIAVTQEGKVYRSDSNKFVDLFTICIKITF